MRRRSWLVNAVCLLCLGLLGGVSAHAQPEPGAAPPPAKQLHVLANQSVLLDSPFDIKRVSIARPETADVMVVSPRQMMVIGKTFGTTTLVYWSREEVAITVEVIVGINLDLVREDLRKIAPDQTFEVTAAGDTLILTGTVGDNVVQTRLRGRRAGPCQERREPPQGAEARAGSSPGPGVRGGPHHGEGTRFQLPVRGEHPPRSREPRRATSTPSSGTSRSGPSLGPSPSAMR